MKASQDQAKQHVNDAFNSKFPSKVLKSFDSVGSVGRKMGHKRYKSSGGSSNLSSFSNESNFLLKFIIFLQRSN